MSDTKTAKVRPILCKVVSDKMNKARVASFERVFEDPICKKYVKRKSRLMFHDEKNETKINDKVLVVPSKPLSAKKRFTLLKIVESATNVFVEV